MHEHGELILSLNVSSDKNGNLKLHRILFFGCTKDEQHEIGEKSLSLFTNCQAHKVQSKSWIHKFYI